MNATLVLDKYIKNYETKHGSNKSDSKLQTSKERLKKNQPIVTRNSNQIDICKQPNINMNQQQKLQLINSFFTPKQCPSPLVSPSTSFSSSSSQSLSSLCISPKVTPIGELNESVNNQIIDTNNYINTSFMAINKVESLIDNLKHKIDSYKREETSNNKNCNFAKDKEVLIKSRSDMSLNDKLENLNQILGHDHRKHQIRTQSSYNQDLSKYRYYKRLENMNEKQSDNIQSVSFSQSDRNNILFAEITTNKECVENFLKECLKIIDQ
jgi:hypothetical protein